jgi:hypothetical protein
MFNLNLRNLKFNYSNVKNFSNKLSHISMISNIHPISFKESKINKNAIIIQNENYHSKIIFPDLKFDLDLNMGNKDYTIKNLIEDNKKKYDKELVLTLSFWDEEGNIIAASTQTQMLLRLPIFSICVDGGDRLYKCLNPYYLGNNMLNKEILTSYKDVDLEKLERYLFNDNLETCNAIKLSTKKHETLKYSSVLKDYIRNKYNAIEDFYVNIKERREKRLQKFLNFFFYACFAQVLSLNLCTFVFFNWDFMEPITQCITYVNIITGYYFWAFTKTDYEMEEMIYWVRNRNYLSKPKLWERCLQEKDEIQQLLKNDVKH